MFRKAQLYKKNTYYSTAAFYDLDINSIQHHDIAFYRDYAETYGKSVLELACGTGRVSIELAKSGILVHALDISQPMLEIFNEKLSSIPSSITKSISITMQDMADFNIEQKFDCIIVPFRGFQALNTEEEIIGCLNSVHKHLKPGGRFILDVFDPGQRMGSSWTHSEVIDWTYKEVKSGRRIRRSTLRKTIDIENQIIYPEIIYRIDYPDGTKRTIREEFSLKYWYTYQMEILLTCNGFRIQDEFGGYDKRKIEQGSELIFCCRAI